MPVSRHEEKLLNLQVQMRENNLELQDYLRDLDNWEGEMKKKEDELRKPPDTDKSSDKLPPVRNKSKKKKTNDTKKNPIPKTTRIKSSDYAAWEKFDIDKACEEVFDEKPSSDSEFSESDEELDKEMQKQQALKFKEKGNEFFKLGNYAMAIDKYSAGLQLDPTNALILANRAMAFLKQEKFAAAEQDCHWCLALDPTYVKGYLRQATARTGLKKYKEAIADYEKVLKLEPTNKMATAEIEKLQKLLSDAEKPSTETEEVMVTAIHKTPCERSKKPLKRIEIQETSIEDQHLPNHDNQLFKQSNDAAAGEELEEIKEKSVCVSKTHDQSSSLPLSSSFKPDVPNSASEIPMQFQYYWSQVRKKPQEMHNYLKKITPEKYPQLISEFLDSKMVSEICSCLKNSFLPDGKLVLHHLTHLSKVNRFQMTILFLSASETNVIKDLFSELQKLPYLDRNQINSLAKQYGLK